MASLTDDDVNGVSEGRKYPDGTIIRVFCMRTDRDAYPSGWAYKLHYGVTEPNPLRTLDHGRFVGISKIEDFRRLIETATPFRDDNSHEDTEGHELHLAPDTDPDIITFPGMVELWQRFWSEIPKSEFEVK